MFLPIIDEILMGDLQLHWNQGHTPKRIFEGPRDEHGCDGEWTLVKDVVQKVGAAAPGSLSAIVASNG